MTDVSRLKNDSKIDRLLKENLKNLRWNHLNEEENREIKKICHEYRDIFHCENLPLLK